MEDKFSIKILEGKYDEDERPNYLELFFIEIIQKTDENQHEKLKWI